MAAAVSNGVYPCYEEQFKVDTSDSSTPSFATIADMETYSVSFDNTVQEWNPYDAEGWVRRLMTAKSVTISVQGKRNVGDTGNDFIASLALKNGREAEAGFQWTFADGTVVEFPNSVFNITAIGAADATNVAPLEFEVQSNGKPTVTAA